MSGRINKYGLSDYIPAPIALQIRRECGFGCIKCGCGIWDYHHIDPEFNDAREHDPSRIGLLCGTCHDYTRGMWSKEMIKEKRAKPKCLETGFSHGVFDTGTKGLVVRCGAAEFISPKSVIRVFGEDILSLRIADDAEGLPSISGVFYDKDGQLMFQIEENQWRGPVENWDIEPEGQTITIRRGPRDIALRLRTIPPSGTCDRAA